MARNSEISGRDCEISRAVKTAQMTMLDIAARHHGFTRKVLSLETGIPTSTIKSWEEGTAMPVAALVEIAAVKGFPNELLSLLFAPADKSICDADEDETDHDDAAIAALEYALKWARARHPDSAGGIRIVHSEKPDLDLAAAGLRDRAAKVA